VIGSLLAHHLRWLASARDVVATALLAVAVVGLVGLLAIHDAPDSARAAAAIVWLVAAIGGLLAGARVIAAERQGGGLRGVLLAPVDRRDVFLARGLALGLIVGLATAAALAATVVFFPTLPGHGDPRLVAIPVIAAIGLGPLGALTGLASLSTSVGELLATGLALPVSAPLIVAGLHATEDLLARSPGWEASLTFATGYAVTVAALAYLVSEPATEVA
jgi:ABC-type transport system involved in cytochrome c biogenesis permease component